MADRAGKVAGQIGQRLLGEKITDRLVSISDADARPIRKGKLRAPTEFGYVFQIAETTENTRRGARGLILPAPSRIGSPNESDLLPATSTELDRLGIKPREIALDGGFQPGSVDEHLPPRERTFIAGRQSAGSRRTDRRLARYRVGAEGRISHLKRGYGLKRSRLKGHPGAQTWTAWGTLAYNPERSPSEPAETITEPDSPARQHPITETAATFHPRRGRLIPRPPNRRSSGASS